MAQAPVCNIELAAPPGAPKIPGLSPLPQNASNSQIINTINRVINVMTKGNFVEKPGSRQSTITRIFDPADKSVYVDVRQITALTFVNASTGQTISWRQ